MIYTSKYQSIDANLLLIILTILAPPLAVLLEVGANRKFWLNLALTLLGYIPGLVHAVWVISRH